MKKLLLLCAMVITHLLSAQKTDILIIGASHDYSNNIPQDFNKIHEKIRKFKPDAFLGEFRTPEEERVLMNYWAKSTVFDRDKRLLSKRFISEKDLPKVISELEKKVKKNPKDMKTRVDLAHAYYLDYNSSNAFFQIWQVIQSLKNKPDDDLFEYSKLVLSPKLDSLKKTIDYFSNDEYDKIAFPMMKELGIKQIYPMDCQTYDLNYQAAIEKFYTEIGVLDSLMDVDSTSQLAIAYKNAYKKYNDQLKGHRALRKTNKYYTEYANTDEAAAIMLSADYLLPEMYDMEKFPKQSGLAAQYWWQMRNEGMCDNVLQNIQKLHAKRIVIIVGANHRKGMQDILRKIPYINVMNINEIVLD